jgi:hypothetical protein
LASLVSMGPLKVPGGRFVIMMAGSLVWDKSLSHTRNREIGGVLALGGRHFINICNNQIEVGFWGSRYIGEDGTRQGGNLSKGIVFCSLRR